MFGGMISKFSLLSKKTDVIPNALLASYLADSDMTFQASNNAYFQIAGISQPITIKLSWAEANVNVFYTVANILGVFPSDWAESLIPISNNGTFQVSNGQYVFIGGTSGDSPIIGNVSVLNNSNSDALLTSVTIDII